MKLTFTWHGKRESYSGHLTLRQLVSAGVLTSLVFIVSSRSTDSGYEDLARIKLAQQDLVQERGELAELEASLKNQMQVYAEQIAQLKHAANKLDETSQQLAGNLEIELPAPSSTSPETQALAIDPALTEEISKLKTQLNEKESQLVLLEKVFTGHHVDEQVEVSGRPVNWGWLSSHYGMRNDPFNGKLAMHKGVDFAGRAGDDVIATGAGLVTWAGERYGYGLLVEIDHGHGLVTRYAHNNSVYVNVGDVVTKGQALAAMGSTGRSTGVHVHYEVLKHGKQVDPLAYLR
jgi:murein DD-endopeptidase MepM/ murein hydrolase activator NlpD